ncbi:hypothetical protein [Longimicrobium sp.]|uniref:hypothetical protein n=1 Tax=Longimicrobium sp. TaxID=2029185 RepID=UPI003B3BDB90
MTSKFLRRCARGAVPVALVLAAACTDSPLAPGVKPEPVPLASIECRVNVPARTTTCSYPEAVLAGSAIRTTRLMGGQDKFVRLENYGNTVENDVLSMFVTVQNLLAEPLGTPDGMQVTGVTVFFAEDPSNGVTVANATGDTMQTGPAQPYFLYNQILTTYQVSDPLLWQFNLNGATSFVFKVYVLASQQDESGNGLEALWSGTSTVNGTDWFIGGPDGNWTRRPVPDATDAVQIPASAPNMPVLTDNAVALHLRVNGGATLGLGGYNLAVGGNVDGAGTISNGSITMSGSNALLMGNVPTLFVSGSTALQGATRATGPVSVTGSLTVADSALSISVP